jgi:hypothetical protein
MLPRPVFSLACDWSLIANFATNASHAYKIPLFPVTGDRPAFRVFIGIRKKFGPKVGYLKLATNDCLNIAMTL